MFTPDATGQVHPGGAAAGGHEYVLDELDVERHRVWMTNSRGNGWGLQGRAWFTFTVLQTLLDKDGDCTIVAPVGEPAPEPVPQHEVATLIKAAAAEATKLSSILDEAGQSVAYASAARGEHH